MYRRGLGLPSGGYTLIEFLVTLAVMVIVLGIAVPNFGAFIARNQVAGVKSAFAASLATARSEAARSGNQVLLVASAGGAPGNEFGGGWDVYIDNDNNGLVDAADTRVRHYEALPAALTLSGKALLVFSASGYLTPAANNVYRLCATDGSTAGYAISVAPSGTTYAGAINNCP
ncbi:MAG: GspH/FimT family pseudopilin [Burkholderiales bacterium]|nr:GspH/FimT family pseudopilin [Burkholderiales bacterium]MDE1927903.1 GspH/FimT family pseudopilin [Burkholderiales bacterium]MDE2161223.1 GspH/FimT family pseudopilin [Burkholderiales bacterium]MDE2503699.1 GspH/FimT family pseudopilin [Burkholderiales bacterium]